MKQQNRLYLIIYVAALLMLSGQLITGCSSTSALKEDEQLFTGLVQQLLPHAVPCAPVDMECFLSVGWSTG